MTAENFHGYRFATLLLATSLILSACFTAPTRYPEPTPVPTIPPPTSPSKPPVDLLNIPDAVPRVEPLSKKGNPAFYEVLGTRYFVLPTASNYVERGVASWYGPGFHKEFTSNGEPYDMYGMTAAHKTLPLPCFVQVTNLTNGKTVILRVNDRGPFKAGRIIDLSYTAATKLDMLHAGTALVEVRTLTPSQKTSNPSPANSAAPTKSLYVQAGAFGSSANADKLVAQLRTHGYTQAFVSSDMVDGHSWYRVRIGPIADVATFDRIVAELKTLGVSTAQLALD